MKPVFKFFTLAIKFYCLFFGHFLKFFSWFVSFIFDKLPTLSICFKNALNHFLVYFSAKNSLRSAKNVIFFILHFGWQASGGAAAPRPPGYTITRE